MALGGKGHRHLAPRALSVADFPTAKEEEFETHAAPLDYKVAARPLEPPTYLSWARQARNFIWGIGCILGEEHVDPMMQCLD
eukprot:3976903-Alexandrium_andersonii.AAC.1